MLGLIGAGESGKGLSCREAESAIANCTSSLSPEHISESELRSKSSSSSSSFLA